MKLLITVLTLSLPVLAQAQSGSEEVGWQDGSPSRLAHHCIVKADQIDRQEDLIWTQIGYQAEPTTNSIYYARVVLTATGCSGVWARPEVKLPRSTAFAIDNGHPIRCFTGTAGGTTFTALTDGSCPTAVAVGQYPDDVDSFPNPSGDPTYNNFYWAFPPAQAASWALAPGEVLVIEFPVTSAIEMRGGAGTDYFLAATGVVDNNSGGAASPWDGAGLEYDGGGYPSTGAWQGAFVFSSAGDENARIAYSEPTAEAITAAGATLCAHVFNGSLCNPFSADTSLAPLAVTLNFAGTTGNAGTESYVSSDLLPSADPQGIDVCMVYGGLKAGQLYEWSAAFPLDVTTNNPNNCAGFEVDPTPRLFTTPPSPTPPARFVLLSIADSPGTLALSPPDGSYASGTAVTVTPTPHMGFDFTGWTLDGASGGKTNPLTITMSANHALTAHFTANGKPQGVVVPGPTPAKKGGCAQTTPGAMALVVCVLILARRRRSAL